MIEPIINFTIHPQVDISDFLKKEYLPREKGFFKSVFAIDLDDVIYRNPHRFLNLMYNFFILSEDKQNFISSEFSEKTLNMWKGYMLLLQEDSIAANMFPFKYSIEYMVDFLNAVSYLKRDELTSKIKNYSLEEIKSFISGIDYKSESFGLGKIKFYQTKKETMLQKLKGQISTLIDVNKVVSFENWFESNYEEKIQILYSEFNNKKLISKLIIELNENVKYINFFSNEINAELLLDVKKIYDDFLYNLIKSYKLKIFDELINEQISKIEIFVNNLNQKFKSQALLDIKIQNKFLDLKINS